MMLLEMIRFLRGRVSFTVQGGYPERFLGQCGKTGIPLWRMRRQADGTLTAETTLSAAKRLKQAGAKSGVTVTVQKQRGVPVLARRYRLRTGVFAGLALLVLLPAVLGLFVWRVEITGNQTLTNGELSAMLTQLGVHRGALRGGVDTRHVERLMVVADDRLSWVGVNLRGSTAFVEVRERDLPPQHVDREIPHNVVASRGGHIVQMDVYEGQPIVRRGDSVVEGDMLVSGIMENGKQENRTVHARASVMAEVEESIAVTVPYQHTVYGYLGLEVHKELVAFGHTFPLQGGEIPPEPYKLEVVYEPLPVVGSLLPMQLITKRYLLLEAATETLDVAAAMAEAERQLLLREKRTFAPDGIINKEVSGQELSDNFILFADYLHLADIAQEREILLG